MAPRSIIEFGLFLYMVFCLACLVCLAVHSQSLVIPIRERLRAAVAITHRVSPFAKSLRSMASKTMKLNHERRRIVREKQDEAKRCRDRTTLLLKYAIGSNFFSSFRQANRDSDPRIVLFLPHWILSRIQASQKRRIVFFCYDYLSKLCQI